MKKNHLEVAFYCDSDMLLFCDVLKEYEPILNYLSILDFCDTMYKSEIKK